MAGRAVSLSQDASAEGTETLVPLTEDKDCVTLTCHSFLILPVSVPSLYQPVGPLSPDQLLVSVS